MTIQGLNARLGLTICEIDDIPTTVEECTKLSIEFAINVLKSLDDNMNGRDIYTCINDKIQELKTYLTE
jgi:hypothetical protein